MDFLQWQSSESHDIMWYIICHNNSSLLIKLIIFMLFMAAVFHVTDPQVDTHSSMDPHLMRFFLI